ncbi:MAG: site-specific DNA-methyltransferase [Campylobacterales bacterium]|nr:site-specific DNA-methyltransferase [Campylobacterales bacterium]
MPTLNWIGKDQIKNHHNEVEYRVIECKESIGDPNSGNLIVKGDNLLALKSLLPYYAGKVKMIYIDPPYNTGNTSWVYNDNVDAPIIKKWLDKNIDANDLSRSDKWLCMMYPRLKLLQQFLKEDGSIFISIDDAEVAKLRLIMDEIFGANNFIEQIVWHKKRGKDNSAKYFSTTHEHILVYAKNINHFKVNKLEIDASTLKAYKNPDDDERGDYRLLGLWARQQGGSRFSYTLEDGYFLEERLWLVNKDSMRRLEDEKRLVRVGDKLYRKLFLYENEGSVPETIWLDSSNNANAKDELKKIFGKNSSLFDTPKPIPLIKKILKIATNKNAIVMDSFAGSGTTAHSVLALNNEDDGNRNFICIEMEEYAEEITKTRIANAVNGYSYTGNEKTELYSKKLTATQILKPATMEKISKEVEEIIGENEDKYDKITKPFKDNTLTVIGEKDVKEFKEGIGGGFQYCELGDPLLDEFGLLNEEITFSTLAKHLYFTEFGEALTTSSIDEERSYVGSLRSTALYLFPENKKFTTTQMKKLIKEEYSSFIVYADVCSVSDNLLKRNNILVKKLPFEIRER